MVKEVKTVPFVNEVNQTLTSFGELKNKELTAKRFEFVNQSSNAIIAKPFWGYGPGNYIEASKLFTRIGTRTDSAHNLFLDVAVELGIPALLAFLLLIGAIIKNQIKNPTVLSFLIVAFLTNSLTDYTFRIYSFFFLFFIIVGLSYQDKGINLNKKIFVILLFLPLAIILYPLLK